MSWKTETDHSEIEFDHVAQVVHPSGQLVLVKLDPAVVAGNAVAVLLAQEDVFQAGRAFDSASAVVLAQPDKTQVLLEDGNIRIGQTYMETVINNYSLNSTFQILFDELTFRDEELVGLLEDAGGQNGIEEGVVFNQFLSCDVLSYFAVLVVVVEKCQKGAGGRAGEGISRNTRKQPALIVNNFIT